MCAFLPKKHFIELPRNRAKLAGGEMGYTGLDPKLTVDADSFWDQIVSL